MYKRIIAPAIIVLAIIAGVFYFTADHKDTKQTKKQPVQTQESNLISTTLKITNDTQKTTHSYKIKTNSTVLDLMESAKAQKQLEYTSKNSSMGVLVESINGVANDSTSQKYWSLYVNDKMAAEGAGTQKITSKDTIEWKYQSF